MWDLPRPGLEPVSPALAGRLSTTAPPGKPLDEVFNGQIEQNKPSPPWLYVSESLKASSATVGRGLHYG